MDKKGPGSHGAAKGIFKGVNEQVQTLLGLDAASLKAELRSGKSLAEIAQAKGITKDTLIAQLQTFIVSNLDQAIKDQKITPNVAAKIKQGLPQKLDAMVTKQHPPKEAYAKHDKVKRTNTLPNSVSQA
ncbi:MAG: hypothetical protein ACYCVD_02520 [Desulfitobacteriaceae bacterium]